MTSNVKKGPGQKALPAKLKDNQLRRIRRQAAERHRRSDTDGTRRRADRRSRTIAFCEP